MACYGSTDSSSIKTVKKAEHMVQMLVTKWIWWWEPEEALLKLLYFPSGIGDKVIPKSVDK